MTRRRLQSLTAHAFILVGVSWLGLRTADAQLLTAYTGDEAGPKNWVIDVATGSDVEGPLGATRALASDPVSNRIFEIEDRRLGRTTVGLRISTVDADGQILQGSLRSVVDGDGRDVRFITSLAYGNGILYAQSSGNSRAGVPAALGTIDLGTFVFTPLPTSGMAPSVSALTYDHDRNELVVGSAGAVNRLFAFDPVTGASRLIVELPPEEGDFDGLAYGRDRIWMDCGAPCGPISVYNRRTGAFESSLTSPTRFGNGSGGAAFLEALAVVPPPPPPPASAQVYLSFRNRTLVPGVGMVADEDVVVYDLQSGAWSLLLDGSDVGLAGLKISGLAVLPDDSLLLSFTEPGALPGVSDGPIDDSDIVRFFPAALGANSAGTFERYLDGSDVGLTRNSEDIDAIAIAGDGRLVISTVGRFTGTGATGADEDLMVFTGTFGADTAGSFELFFDGSDFGLGGNNATDVDGAAFRANDTLLLSIVRDTTVGGLSVGDEDLLEVRLDAADDSASGEVSVFLDLSTVGIDFNEDVGAVFIR